LEDKFDDAKTGRAILFGNKVSPNLSLRSARPTSKRLIEVVRFATITHITQQTCSKPITTPRVKTDLPVA